MAGEFWNNAAMEPKRSHRFLIQFDLLGLGTSQIYGRKVSKPAFEIGQSEHKFLGQTYYYPGAVTWTDVTATLVNAATPDFDAIFQALLKSAGWVEPDQISSTGNVDNAGTVNKFDAVTNLGSVLIKELDGDNRVLGSYQLQNAWVKSLSWGELDYSSEDLLTVDVVFRYDWATYSKSRNAAG
jgi:hypothetical protein|tara:strand:+ start:1650 stop:2198 length:549 start_codon:yes stop_codon:yes gene_type:complete